MRNSPFVAFLVIFAFCTLNTVAQEAATNKAGSNGKLNYSYTSIQQDQFTIHIILKNDQFIYKQAIDTITINNAAALLLLKQDLKAGLDALQNVNTNFSLQRPAYTLYASDTGISGFFLVLSNPSGSINTSNTKYQIKIFLEWLDSIQLKN